MHCQLYLSALKSLFPILSVRGSSAPSFPCFRLFLASVFPLLGCRHDGSEWNDSTHVGGLQDTQVCVLEICGTERKYGHLA